MTMLRLLIAAAIAVAPVVTSAQDEALSDRVMQAVRAAMAPALPFPASDVLGSVPADGKSDAPWMVRPIQPGERTLEILANPLNEEHQRRAAKAMAQIEQSIETAQRRAEVQYERAVAEAKRTGRSQDVDGVTLSDEGLAGARIDAESHVTIDVLFNQPSYRVEIASSVEPSASREVTIAGAAVLAVPSNVFRDEKEFERLCEAETVVFLGRVTAPDVRRRRDDFYEVTAAGIPSENGTAISSIVIRMRGNDTLIAVLLRKGNWASLVELLK